MRVQHADKMNEIYEFVSQCPDVVDHEEMHLRQALFLYEEGKTEQAKKAINQALKIAKQDKMRVWYWAGIILKDTDYLWQVVINYPYSFHAIKAARILHSDLYQFINSRPLYKLTTPDNSILEYVHLLSHFEQWVALDKLLRLNLNNPTIDNETWFYIVRLLVNKAPHQYGVNLVSRIAQNNPAFINSQVLELSYIKPYFENFKEEADKVNLDPYLLVSLSRQESGFNTNAYSGANARGLMQLLPQTAKNIAKVKTLDLYTPEVNINLGTQYFYQLYQKYNSVEPALAAYNAGPSRVDGWLKMNSTEDMLLFIDLIPFKETRSYVSLILRNHYYYLLINDDENKGIKSKLIEDLVK